MDDDPGLLALAAALAAGVAGEGSTPAEAPGRASLSVAKRSRSGEAPALRSASAPGVPTGGSSTSEAPAASG